MRRISFVFISVLCVSLLTTAQQRVLGDVKKKISSLTLTTDVYKSAIAALKPALTHDETKSMAETWYLQGKLQYGYYDKFIDAKTVGKKVDVKVMGHALIDGYSGYTRALSLDTVVETSKNGEVKIDKKTGLPKFKTKFSSEIVSRLISHHSDYNVVGGELYNIKDWDGAIKAWEIFYSMNDFIKTQGGREVPDSVLGQARYFQAIAMWQKGDNAGAVNYFSLARSLGYVKKESYDYALVCLSSLNDETGIVKLAKEAYSRFGSEDTQYVRILINDNINKKDYVKASELLDEVIKSNDDAEIQNLKGIVVEQQSNIEKALPYFMRCVELDPENAQGLFNVGRYYYNEATMIPEKYPRLSGRKLNEKLHPLYREALPYFEKSYKIDPSNEDVKNALRNIYYKLGEGKKLQQIEK